MKRNTALFGASLVAGMAAAAGLVATGSSSSAAGVYYGVSWADSSAAAGNSGWTTGSYSDPNGLFSGSATAGSGTVQFVGGTLVTVSVTCTDGKPVTTVAGGGAAGKHEAGSNASAADFTGNPNISGTVTFGSTKVGGHVAGAYVDLSAQLGPGSHVALAGADCSAAPTSTPPTSTTSPTTGPTSTTNPPTSTGTNPPTSTATNPPTSTGTNPPTSTGTNPPTSTPTDPSTTPPPTTEPPTPTPTTTTLPVTG